MRNSSEYRVYNELDDTGREYISKCKGVVKISESFIKYMAERVLMIKSTLNLIKTSFNKQSVKEEKAELKVYIEVIRDKAVEMFRTYKNMKMKLIQIPKLRFNSKMNSHTKEVYSDAYTSFHTKMLDIMDNFSTVFINNVYELLKVSERFTYGDIETYDVIKWHATFFLLLKEGLRLLKICGSNIAVINSHMDSYRSNLINKMKIRQITDEVKGLKPVRSMINEEEIEVKTIAPGEMFSYRLFKKDSTPVKDAYEPFSEDDIKSLNEEDVKVLYAHNNFDENFRNNDYHVLIVDNDKAFSDLTKLKIEEVDFKVTVYNDSQEAIKNILRLMPDIIVTEVKMENFNGFAFLKAMKHFEMEAAQKGLALKIPVIMFSKITDEKVIAQCLKLGAVDYISKPQSIGNLLIKIKYHLTSKY